MVDKPTSRTIFKTMKTKGFKEYCVYCKKTHIMILRKCPSCGVYETPQPKSEKVWSDCWAEYSCDGCIAYRDHLG